MAGLVILLGTFLLAALVGGPVLALLAWRRVRTLERRLAALEAGRPAPVGGPPAADRDEARGFPVLPPAAPAPPAPPREPFDWETLIAGRWLNRLGLVAVAIGTSFFLKYAIDNAWIGPRGQVAAGLLAGAALAVWSVSFARRGLGYFADGLAGLGAAILYLSLWAGTSYYGFMPPAVGFAAMAAVTASMAGLAFGRDSERLAALALAGGFATPALVSTGRDAQVVLFLYLALLDSVLLAAAFLRRWRYLELPALVLTWAYFWIWYGRFYTDDALLRTALFAALFFALLSVVPVIRSTRDPESVRGAGLSALVLLNGAMTLLAMYALLWPDERWTLTMVTLALAAAHLVAARAAPASAPPGALSPRVLFAGLALTFVTVAIPIRLDGHWITLAWAIEAGVLVWTGFWQASWHARAAAYVIFILLAVRLLLAPLPATTFLFNVRLSTALVVTASAALAVWLGRRHAGRLSPSEPFVLGVLGVGANILLLWALTLEVDLYFRPLGFVTSGDSVLGRSLAISLLWIVYASALVASGAVLAARALRWQGLALFGVAALKVFFVDLDSLSGFYRVVSTIALGLVLLIVSYLYQRSVTRKPPSAGVPT